MSTNPAARIPFLWTSSATIVKERPMLSPKLMNIIPHWPMGESAGTEPSSDSTPAKPS